ncbi:hypothetical protein MKW92_042137 [Papaver armeniacum]|nr:hypothetical protein MKW92_042137 [Papaver armeniacum]
MRLTELLHPKKGFIIDDVCYIKVEIICVMEIVKSLQVPIEEEKTTDSREKKEIPPGSVETTTQSAGDSKSGSTKNPGDNQNTEAKDEKRKSSLCRWFQEQKGNIGKCFSDDSGYQRLQHE